jgi:hypothetical protein
VSFGDIPIYKDPNCSADFDDGRPRLFTLVRHMPGGPYILVHPSRWDAFFMAVNQPDVFKHPEVQELLGLANPPRR